MSLTAATVVTLVEIGVDATKAILAAEEGSPTAETLATRLLDAALGMVPVSFLRAHLDAATAAAIDESVDIAEEAKLKAQQIAAAVAP